MPQRIKPPIVRRITVKNLDSPNKYRTWWEKTNRPREYQLVIMTIEDVRPPEEVYGTYIAD